MGVALVVQYCKDNMLLYLGNTLPWKIHVSPTFTTCLLMHNPTQSCALFGYGSGCLILDYDFEDNCCAFYQQGFQKYSNGFLLTFNSRSEGTAKFSTHQCVLILNVPQKCLRFGFFVLSLTKGFSFCFLAITKQFHNQGYLCSTVRGTRHQIRDPPV